MTASDRVGTDPRLGSLLLATLLVAAGSSSAACRRDGGPSGADVATTQPAVPVERTAERGPVKLTVRADRNRITIADAFELTIEVRAEPEVDVEMPKFGHQIEQFIIRDFRQSTPARDIADTSGAAATERVWRQTYTLESYISGRYEIPGIEVKFTDRRPQRRADPAATQPAIESSVRTEPLEVEVESLLAGQFDPQQFHDLKGPETLPRPRSAAIALAAGGALAALGLAAAAAWWWRRRRARQATVRMPPHQWAMLELERLVAEDLVGRGAVAEFYYRLNGLLRQYIELRIGLAAPEQTSEEFLRALDDDHRLPDEHKESLRGFVAACDPVKYARYAPGREEIEAVFAAARDFIMRTAEREREVELAESAA